MKPFLRFERDGAVVVLTMDDPAMRNPLSGNTAVREFVAACARIEADPDVRAVVITGADPAFSSGGSLDAMREDWRDRKRGVAVRAQLREGVQPLSLALLEPSGAGHAMKLNLEIDENSQPFTSQAGHE